MRWTERLFDPFAPAAGPPPRELRPFVGWMLEGAWPAVALLGGVSLLVGVSEAVAAWLLGWIVDATAADAAAFFAANGALLVAAAVFFMVVRPALMVVSSAVSSRAIAPGLFHLGVWRLHNHTLGQSLGYFENDFTGRLAQKHLQTANALTESVNEIMNSIGFAIAAAVGALAALAVADPRLGLVLALWLIAYGVLVHHYLPRIRKLAQRRAEARAALSGQLVDTLAHMATVKLFARAGREADAAHGALGRYREAALAFGRTVQHFRAWLAILAGTLPVLLVGTALGLWYVEAASVGAIAIAGFLAMRLSQMSGWISFTAMGIFTNIGVLEDGMRTLTPPHDVVDRPNARTGGRARGAVAYENVVFRYGRADGGGLEGFSLDIRAGEKVALVGRSGAGKSTALSLLPRLRDVEGGRIALDGVDIRDLTQDHLRRHTTSSPSCAITAAARATTPISASAGSSSRAGSASASHSPARS